jgi:hypothetical protein
MDKHTATELAYKNGYEAGKKEFADKLASIILKKKEAVSKSRETYYKGEGDEDGFAYWLGRGTTYAEVLTLILELREGITEED